MKKLWFVALLVTAACASQQPSQPAAAVDSASPPRAERLDADAERTTAAGNTFIAPAAWTVASRGRATVLEAPEGGSFIAIVDVEADDADAALAAAWQAYKPDAPWPLKAVHEQPDRDGWSRQRVVEYQTSPNERRDVSALVRFANGVWTVVIYDVAQAVGEKRGSQVALVLGRLQPKGFTRESFAGKPAHRLDEARLAELSRFVDEGRRSLGVPGVGLGIVQDGRVVYAGGFGVRRLGGSEAVGADTLFMVASNTKALTTLLLAKLVEQGRFDWKTPVTALLPTFALGDPETTRQVRVEHLICACTGMPRQDLEWLLEFAENTPARALATLATMQPTSGFGELFQYSNPMAAAAGYTAGHVLYPEMELGAAYDRAMHELVFEPLGMRATTFDFARAMAGEHADAHAPDIDGRPALAVMDVNYSVIPVRPAGGAWSSVRDMLAYVQMELSKGLVADGSRYIEAEPLLARRAPQVAMSKDGTYGMGLMVERAYDVEVVHHGGDLIGHHSDMLWLPEHNVGAVILTNGDPGWLLRSIFRRKLLEVLFDGRPEADERLTAMGRTFFDALAAERKLLTVPADAGASAALAPRYANAALGSVTVRREAGRTVFDFGEWSSEVASRSNPDGTVSLLTTAPGMTGLEFVVGPGPGRTLVMRDAQHEYVFEELQ